MALAFSAADITPDDTKPQNHHVNGENQRYLYDPQEQQQTLF